LPDDFCQSQTEIDNFRPALTKVVRQFEKLAGIPKSRTETEISSGKLKIPDGNSQFPDRIWKSKPAFEKVRRLLKKPGNSGKSQTEIEISSRLSEFPAGFFNFRATLQKDRQLFTFPDNFTEIRPEISKVV